MAWYERIVAAHVAVTENVSHAERLTSDRYFVWQEDGTNDLLAENGHGETAVTGVTDLYTKLTFDPFADALGVSFTEHGIAWALISIDYEAETEFFHYSWNWEIC